MNDAATTHQSHAAAPLAIQLAGPVSARFMLALALAAASSTAGCKLIDQRTFDRHVDRKPVPHALPPAPSRPGVPPLATVRFAQAPDTWQTGLDDIVRQALALKPLALFTVETIVPARGTPQAQAAALATAATHGGRAVADTIVSAGASSAQIEMTAMSDGSVTQPEVRVYVK